MSHKRIEYLHRHKIIYHRWPINDKPTEEYDWGYFYENGTYECYSLFRSKALINTFKSLKWHLYVLWYLNPNLDKDKFLELAIYISNKDHGFVTFEASKIIINKIVDQVYLMDLDKPPANKLRKIIFKDNCVLTTKEKLSIVGKIVGKKKLSESDIYEAMLYIYDTGKKITITNLSKYLGCSARTIHRNISNDLKKEKKILNDSIAAFNKK